MEQIAFFHAKVFTEATPVIIASITDAASMEEALGGAAQAQAMGQGGRFSRGWMGFTGGSGHLPLRILAHQQASKAKRWQGVGVALWRIRLTSPGSCLSARGDAFKEGRFSYQLT